MSRCRMRELTVRVHTQLATDDSWLPCVPGRKLEVVAPVPEDYDRFPSSYSGGYLSRFLASLRLTASSRRTSATEASLTR